MPDPLTAARELLAEMSIPLDVREIVARKAINRHPDAPRRLAALKAWALLAAAPKPAPE
ncbi:MAG TPA: hypothetical protein QGF58_21495 [Myxococcota bacterium]|nr:hypothetical protein [Myxococcota bacterium]